MTTILIIIQVFIVFCLAVAVLVQKTSSDSLSGLSGGGNNVLSSKSTRNIFTRATMVLGIAFMVNSLLIAKFYVNRVQSKTSIAQSLDAEGKQKEVKPVEAPTATE